MVHFTGVTNCDVETLIDNWLNNTFEPTIGRYNDHNGKIRFRLNIGTVKPPTKKLQVPNYGKTELDELQNLSIRECSFVLKK